MIARTLSLFGRMMRLRVVVTMWTFMLVGLARHAGPTIGVDLVAAALALAASYAVATSLNDVADIDIDRANGLRDRGRPLVLGVAGVGDLRRTAGFAAGVAALAAVPLGAAGLGVIGLCLGVDVFYSAGPLRLSRRWTLAPVALTVAYVALPYWLGIVVAHSSWDRADAWLLLGLGVLFFARIILKDIRDRLGDAEFGKRTLLLRLGKNATCLLSVAGAILGTTILIAGSGAPGPIGIAFALDAGAIVWMLVRLRGTNDAVREQVTIGTAARAGNAMLVSLIGWLLLSGVGAPAGQAALLVWTITAVAAWSFLALARHPERARIAYKAPAQRAG
jgi:4-hydroxybenzoate polyprenyltransferase